MSDEPTFMTYVTTAQAIYGPFSALGKLDEEEREKLVERLREEGVPVADKPA